MAVRTSRIIVCEGPDDLGVLRLYIKEVARRRNLDIELKGSKHAKKLEGELDRFVISIEAAPDGKSDLGRHVNSKVDGSAGERPDFIGVVFDPDKDRVEKENLFFEKDYNKNARDHRIGSDLERNGCSWQVTVNKRRVEIMPGAWRLSPRRELHYGLPDHHSLERVLLEAILDVDVHSDLVKWAELSMTSLLEIVNDHGWKRAFRLWNAALHPKSESLADKLIQDRETKHKCFDLLDETPVRALIERMLKKPVD